MRLKAVLPLLLVLSVAVPAARAQGVQAFMAQPSKVDPAVTQFDDQNVILLGGGKHAPLVVFFTGTGGKPEWSIPFLTVIAEQGYNVIALAYDDAPSVSAVCPQDPDPDCSRKFRQMRVYGTGGPAAVSNPVAESIQTRLAELLRALARAQPDVGWDAFLNGDAPRWDQIVVSGLSQGAGMAALIAKQNLTRRVVLFSSPWDVTGPDRHPAPWLSEPSATPMDRWFSEYHLQEHTAPLIIAAYAALGVPADHVLVFDNELPPDSPLRQSNNPYHLSTIEDPAYADQWRRMFGQAGAQDPN